MRNPAVLASSMTSWSLRENSQTFQRVREDQDKRLGASVKKSYFPGRRRRRAGSPGQHNALHMPRQHPERLRQGTLNSRCPMKVCASVSNIEGRASVSFHTASDRASNRPHLFNSVQSMDARFVGLENTRIEHRSRLRILDQFFQSLDEPGETCIANADRQAGTGAELSHV